jgi:3-oxoadipate enol-lactonase
LHDELTGPAGAPVLVLGSSLGTTGAMWRPQLADLHRHFRVLRYDHLGHGGSAVPPGPYSIELLGAHLVDLLDELGLARVHYGGLSLGGMVGMWLAAHHPDRVDRLALLCTSAYLPPASGWLDRAAAVRGPGLASIADVVVGRWFTPGFAQREPSTVDEYARLLVSTPPEGYASCCEAIAGMDLRAELAGIRAPTLVLAGDRDPATPAEHGALIADGIPGARLELVPGAAHLANVEQPAAVTRRLLAHLRTEEER